MKCSMVLFCTIIRRKNKAASFEIKVLVNLSHRALKLFWWLVVALAFVNVSVYMVMTFVPFKHYTLYSACTPNFSHYISHLRWLYKVTPDSNYHSDIWMHYPVGQVKVAH